MNRLDRLRASVTERYGLVASLAPTSDLARRWQAAAEWRGLEFEELLGQAERDPGLFRELAGMATVGESYFFRIPEQLIQTVEMVRNRASMGLSTQIVSIGCSRGEEPYSIALMLLDNVGEWVRPLVHIVASDISHEALEVARSRLYTAWSLRTVPSAILGRRFEQEGGLYRLSADLGKWVDLHHLSATELLERLEPNTVNVVFFRNVGIYLAEPALRAIYGAITQALTSDGVLFQAATDPIPTSPLLQRVPELGGTYARRDRPFPLEPPACSPGNGPSPRGAQRRPGVALARRSPRLLSTPTPRIVLAPLSSPHVCSAPTAGQLISRAQAHLERGVARPATEDLRGALYLAPEDHLTRFLYCVALLTDAQPSRALQQLRTLRRSLQGLTTEAVLSDGHTTVSDLNEAMSEIEQTLT